MDDSKREEARVLIARAVAESLHSQDRVIVEADRLDEVMISALLGTADLLAVADAVLAALTPPADPTDDDREALVAILVNNRQAIAGSMHQYVDSETTADLVLASGFRRPTPATREQVVRELVNAEVIVNDGDGQWEQPMRKEAERIADTLMSRFTITPKDDTA